MIDNNIPIENKETGLTKLTELIESIITGIPAPVKKNFLKAFGQLCTAVVDVPVAWLEGKSSEIRATTDARLGIIKRGGEEISGQIEVPKEYIQKASSKFASKIIKEQINLDQILLNAANEIANNKKIVNNQPESEDISEDWLNEFENLARLKSSEDMKLMFGKILSGEIVKPGSFSIKTIKLISELDNQAATLFQLLCSQAVSIRADNHIFDARVVSLNGNAGSNSLSQYGLSFDALNILHEYGLIISDYNSYAEYSSCIVNEQNKILANLNFNGKNYGLIPSDREKYDKVLKLHGVALTKAGVELLDIIPTIPADDYMEALKEYFEKRHLDLVILKKTSGL